MRYAVIALGLVVGACAPQQQQQSPERASLATTYELYQQCLAAMPPDKCEVPRARFEAARAYADSAARTAPQPAARPPLVLSTLQFPTNSAPPPRQQITCTTYGNMTNCF